MIGNGPSLKGFDLKRLNGVHTLGMNAAYRYWREIGWYPTYYACLDDELIETHWREIRGLVRDRKVQKAFVTAKICDFDPSLATDDGFIFLDEYISYWNNARGKRFGLGLKTSCYFLSAEPSKLTTGSHSIRFVAELGYDEIWLMGIDLKYVEILPEAKRRGGNALQMVETPKANPNYFFDSYQQAGDRYNIPNPSSHNGNLHYSSLAVVRDDFRKLKHAPGILNLNSESRIFEEQIFPYLHPDIALNDRPLSAIAVPVTARDRSMILNQLWLFQQDDFNPLSAPMTYVKPELTYVFNSGDISEISEEITDIYENSKTLQSAFSCPTVRTLDLDQERDVYIRDYRKNPGRYGFKAGPNTQFFETMNLLAATGYYTFLMEADCVPIRSGWLTRLQEILRYSEPFWIMGSAYRGLNSLENKYKRHLNGNAVYAAGDPSFNHFLRDFWRPHLERIVDEHDPRIAYDCVLEMLIHDANSMDPLPSSWDFLKNRLHLFRYTDYIQNRSGKRDSVDTPPDMISHLRRFNPDTYFLHGKIFADAIADLRTSGAEPTVDNLVVPTAASCVDEDYRHNVGSDIDDTQYAEDNHFEVPRILVFDFTAAGDGSATGELKANLFANWPAERYMQVCANGRETVGIANDRSKRSFSGAAFPDLMTILQDFDPELIMYRPVPDVPVLHSAAMFAIAEFSVVPLVTWIMDDWPKRLLVDDPSQFHILDIDLRYLLERSALRLSICDAMSAALEERYNQVFHALANGVEIYSWPENDKLARSELVVRYAGALAPHMGSESIRRVAQAVEELANDGHPIRLEMRTRDWWARQQQPNYVGLKHTTISTDLFSPENYRNWLRGADAVLIAYNFDDASLRYTSLSMANKMPECFASGVPLIAHGPVEAESIRFIKETGCAVVIDREDVGAVKEALLMLLNDPGLRDRLGQRGRELALSEFNIETQRRKLWNYMNVARNQDRGELLDRDYQYTVGYRMPKFKVNAALMTNWIKTLLRNTPSSALRDRRRYGP